MEQNSIIIAKQQPISGRRNNTYKIWKKKHNKPLTDACQVEVSIHHTL